MIRQRLVSLAKTLARAGFVAGLVKSLAEVRSRAMGSHVSSIALCWSIGRPARQ
jgi:hypothetical protein